MARRRHRVRRVAKWAGLTVCVLIAAVWAINYWWGFLLVRVNPGGRAWGVAVDSGCCMAGFGQAPANPAPPGWYCQRNWSGQLLWLPQRNVDPLGTEVWLPLWMPFLAVAFPTSWIWWRDWRRALPGHCRCGYDLTGLAFGAACPECGGAQKAVA